MDVSQLLELFNLTEEAVTVIGVLVAFCAYLILDGSRCNKRNQLKDSYGIIRAT